VSASITYIPRGTLSAPALGLPSTAAVMVCSRPNSLLEYCRPAWTEPPAPCYIDILYEDEYLVAIHKPTGLQVKVMLLLGTATAA